MPTAIVLPTDEILARYAAGATQQELADDYGVSQWAISQLQQRRGVWALRYTGTAQVRRIAKLLYEDANVYLERKYERYLQIVA